MTDLYCGLDFGTSNSTVGIGGRGQPTLCALEDGRVTLPSALFFDFEQGSVRYGRDAVGAYIDGVEGRLMRALKSVLGSSLMAETTQVQRGRVKFSELIGMFMGRLKASAETQLGKSIDSVVLGRPVRFVDDDDVADRQAENELIAIAREQGFRHIEMQLEPVAAALDYETSLSREELALIIDLGGGTSDFAIARLSPERARHADRKQDILGRSGVHIGGTDFDRMISMAQVMPELGLKATIGPKKLDMPAWLFRDLATWHRIPFVYSPKNLSYLRSLHRTIDRPDLLERLIDVLAHRNGHRINAEVEAAKIALSSQDQAKIRLPIEKPLDLTITRTQLEDALRRGITDIIVGLRQCLDEADVKADHIQSVFLTGGSTAIPVVRQRILAELPNARPVEGDVFGSVGLGLTIDAGRRFGSFR